MIPKCMLLSLWAVCIFGQENLSYKELLDLNATCPNDNCYEETNPYRHRTCECDEKCPTFGDCCIDSTHVQKSAALNPMVHCTSIENLNVFVISDCLPQWTGDNRIKRMCENVSQLDQIRDPFLKVPVTDLKSTITYKNRFCAICNNIHHAVSWQLKLTELWTPFSYNMTYGNLTIDYVLTKMVYNEDEKTWGVWLYSYPNGWSFTAYEINVELQTDLSKFVRSCRGPLVSECSENWTDAIVRSKCEAYQGSLYIMDESFKINQYRNVHCALCNFMNVTNPICILPSAYGFPNLNFALTLDFNSKDGNIVGSKQLCEEGQVFDPFSKKCRALVCGLPGFKLENGQCVES